MISCFLETPVAPSNVYQMIARACEVKGVGSSGLWQCVGLQWWLCRRLVMRSFTEISLHATTNLGTVSVF